MSNICDTQYKVRGSRKALSDLWNTLQMMEVNRLLSNKKAFLCVVIIVVRQYRKNMQYLLSAGFG